MVKSLYTPTPAIVKLWLLGLIFAFTRHCFVGILFVVMKKIICLITAISLISLSSSVWAQENKGYILKQDVPEYLEVREPLGIGPLLKNIILLVDFEAFLTYSRLLDSKNDTMGGSVSGSVAPVYKINKQNYIIPFYSGQYNKSRQAITQEEGAQLYTETQLHNTSLEYKHIVNDKLILKPNVFATWSFNKETADEKWHSGLYDYHDLGGSFNATYQLKKQGLKQSSVSLSSQYYRREYPHFQSLISLASITAAETDEKDYDGIRNTLGYSYLNPDGLSLEADYSLLLKIFIDKKVIGSDGVLKSDKRFDNEHTFDLNFKYSPPGALSYILDNQYVLNISDQNFYDSLSTLSLSDDVFTKNYFNYQSYQATPRLVYTKDLGRGKDMALVVDGGYSFLIRLYGDRKKQDGAGNYTNKDQLDFQHQVFGRVSYPLVKGLDLVFKGDYSIYKSNQLFDRYYKYNYDIYNVSVGISYEY